MAVMKTPGVYIVEKNAFPNSVVEVATAVPAFIGYTEKADNQNNSLHKVPWRISSMGEYEQYFGAGPKPSFKIAAEEDELAISFRALTKADDPGSKAGYKLSQLEGSGGGRYGLYYAMRHFFQNNGGPCYVVSVGNYQQDLELDAFNAGITELLKEQEPTMLVIPEAVRLELDACKDLQQAMLSHCGLKMRNRIAILDVCNGDKPNTDASKPIDTFRNNLGINFLDFAAAYYPWLNTTVVGDRELSYENIESGSHAELKKLLRAELNLPDTLPTEPPPARQVQDLFDAVASIGERFDLKVAKEARQNADDKFIKDAVEKARKAAKAEGKDDKAVAKAMDDAAKAAAEQIKKDADARKKALTEAAPGGDADAAKDADAEKKPDAAKDSKDAEALAVLADNPLSNDDFKAAVLAQVQQLHKALAKFSPLYKAIMVEARRQLNVLPPSAAMAGLYTMVDNTRGVWKAPANYSLAGVNTPCVSISAEQQEDLNVTAQGKSINAIRTFMGEGVLVWGARTLDGNSLDWRYINVRRTMIMLEESCRLAAKAMVFEPNVANTWVTIKSMIGNFLTSVWKRGGLMGAVPEDAFSVHVGLGETMTPEDVLEGILRVTVLVAMVRPAEFIEITFQQLMPKS